MRSNELLAPLSGVVVPLRQVPDEVFARGLAGDGVAIDPISEEVLAPIAGTVSQLHRCRHAVAVKAADGVEVLVHVGLDTVKLEGRGFTALVALGERVAEGQPLLRFDADLVAREAKSLLTCVLVQGAGVFPVAKETVAAGALLLRLAASQSRADERGAAVVRSQPVVLQNLQGLHARPAAVLADAARRYRSSVQLLRGDAAVDAKSIIALMTLSTRRGDLVHLEASGPDAAAAIAELGPLLSSGLGEEPAQNLAPVARAQPAAAGELGGMPASEGLAVGTVVQHRMGELSLRETSGPAPDERKKLLAALREAALQLEALAKEPARAALMHVQQSLLEDPELVRPAHEAVTAGKSAAFAWHAAVAARAAKLEQLDQALLRERAADLRDVGRRVLALLGALRPGALELMPETVLIAEELTPSELAALDATRLAALCTTTGSPTSHAAILARSLGIPAICGIDAAALALAPGTRVCVDGTRGLLELEPTEARVAEVKALRARAAVARERERGAAQDPALTRDGHRVEVVANISSLADARKAVEGGAEGVGLLRSEYLFFGREQAPTEDEQAQLYGSIAEALGPGRPLVIRTLDVGGDKPLPYLPLPAEKNPFLGVRGIRVSLAHPELFRAQLRAIARASRHGDVRVMFPMISGLDELRAARRMLDEERGGAACKVGIMIEVPSAVAIATHLAREVDFFSIGTNDLTQYALAIDRGHPVLAPQADALHPAVLKLIAQTVDAGHRCGRKVAVCGGVASEPSAVPVLVGMGVDELSVSVPAIAQVKAAVGRWSLGECQAIARQALALATPREVRELLGGARSGPKMARVGT